MHEVLIVSDSHGLETELEVIKKRHNVQRNFHCGDSELLASSDSLEGFQTVEGNCDWNGDFPLEEVVEIGGLRFFITHGHLFGVKSNLLNLHYRALEVKADIVCFGHSHIAYAEKIEEQLYINPGSIRLPKKFHMPSYVLLRWDDITNVFVQFYNVNGDEITTFPYEENYNLK